MRWTHRSRLCGCGHERDAHRHHRRGTDCTLRVPALVTPESGVSATPPPRMVTPTGWEVHLSMRASVRYGSPEAGTSGRSGSPRETRSDGSAHLPVMLHDRLTGTGQRPGGSVVNHNRCSRVCYAVPRECDEPLVYRSSAGYTRVVSPTEIAVQAVALDAPGEAGSRAVGPVSGGQGRGAVHPHRQSGKCRKLP